MRSVLVWLMVLSGGVFVPTKLPITPAPTCYPAELFVTDNTDPLFEIQANVTIAQNGAAATGSTPLGRRVLVNRAAADHLRAVARISSLQSRELTLHTLAAALRRQFNQEAVLTFDYLPQDAPAADAIAVTVPDIDLARFRDAFVSDPAAHRRLRGGSVTTTDHTLILIAGNGDLDIVRRLVGAAGGHWSAANIAYGKREFVKFKITDS